METPDFFVIRNQDEQVIKNKLYALSKGELKDSTTEITDVSIDDSFSADHLKAMQFVAKMKEAADRVGAGFIGGFISPDGKRFMMTNQEQISPEDYKNDRRY